MAGVADRAMREICAEMGAAFTVGELTSAKGVSLGDKKSAALLTVDGTCKPCASQLFGCESDVMAIAAKAALSFNPSFIDINMGCPAPKVAGNGGGSALMLDPDNAARIVEAVVKAVSVPVTVKMRTGWDSDSINAPKLAVMCENAGASAITVHGRNRNQMYAPPVDYDTIAEVKKSVKIPVIANGDIFTAYDAKSMLEETGAAAVMIGRGSQGNPWIFKEITELFETGRVETCPTGEERISMAIEHITLLCEIKGEHRGILEARKHASWYIKGLGGAAQLRNKINTATRLEEMSSILRELL
jgi:nifR3 family TIM-barrel protein